MSLQAIPRRRCVSNDARTYHDRLLLGLSGIMSETELHEIRRRLHQGERQKAARGKLRLPLPRRPRL